MIDPRGLWQQTRERFEAQSLRERALLLLCLVAVVIGFWQWLVEIPAEGQRAEMSRELEALASEQQALEAQKAALVSGGPGQSARRELAALESRREALDERLAGLSQGLVSAEQLPEMLQQVLVSTTELRLDRVRTLPVEALPLAGASAGEDGEAATGVYRHTVELRVSGDFFEVYAFIERLESLPWRFYWERLDYEVAGYPLGEVRLRVYTLSAEEGLLGV